MSKYPGFQFPPETPLFPRHEYILQYQQDFVNRFHLSPHILLNHTVVSTSWAGEPTNGMWHLRIRNHEGKIINRKFDHLVVATGRYAYPYMPKWEGLDIWRSSSPTEGLPRSAIHSMWYRSAKTYENRTVVLVGTGASARGIAEEITSSAFKIYHSVRDITRANKNAVVKPEISHFTATSAVFSDGTVCSDVDSVISATGYEPLFPFLDLGGVMRMDPGAHSNSTHNESTLVNNLKLIFPLYQHIVSLSPAYPVGALSFVGLPIRVTYRPLFIAQSLLIAHTIANASLLPPRAELLQDLAKEQDKIRHMGFDPYEVGHFLGPDGLDHQSDYQDALVEFLRARGAVPKNGAGGKFVERWRRELGTEYARMQRGWRRIEAMGQEEVRKWIKGVSSEVGWVKVMKGVDEWQARWEAGQGNVAHVP
ncbi:hypothetical protein HWV62_22431 [Athelia sp. TMB]|nr:hypothetical protein HWV62_22431 [Athelia sp. TMB]